jgi:hypothetical protein
MAVPTRSNGIRREEKWVVLEMTSRGEEEAKGGGLVDIVCRIGKIEKNDIYIPVIKTGGVVTFLIEGYIFIKSGYPSSSYYRLLDSSYIDNSFVSVDEKTGLFFHTVISDEELKEMVNKAMCRGAVLEVGGKGRIKNGDFKGFEGEIMDIINLGMVEKESGVERLRRWVICGCPDMRVVRRNRVREWVILGCKKIKEVVGIKYENELTYYVILIKMRSVEILTVIDGFSVEGVR